MELKKIDFICQLVIPVMSMTTVYLLTRKDKYMRYGYVVGFFSQPFWLFTTAFHSQFGMFLAACFFTVRWGIGIKNHVVTETTENSKSFCLTPVVKAIDGLEGLEGEE